MVNPLQKTERIEVVKRSIDPATSIIMISRLADKQNLATYYLIFPFLIGILKTYAVILKRLRDKIDGLHQELMTRIDMDITKKDVIVKSMDIQVLENGAIRGFLQDKWDCGSICPCERPFVFMNVVSHGQVYPIQFFGYGKNHEVLSRIWNAATVCLDPSFISIIQLRSQPQSQTFDSYRYGIPPDLNV